MVQQNESFNYLRYSENYMMDSWPYEDDISKSKPRLQSDEDLAIDIFYDTCKVIIIFLNIYIFNHYSICIIYKSYIINISIFF